jgi:hypothetical protein
VISRPMAEATELVGIPPEFKGRRTSLVSQFKVFMLLNRNSEIARDPVMRAAYFLNITRGPHNESQEWDRWVGRNSSWLLRVESDPGLLPRGMNAWDVLVADFFKTNEFSSGRI